MKRLRAGLARWWEPRREHRSKSKKNKISLRKCKYWREYSVTHKNNNLYIELRQISNVSDKVTEVGEKLIEYRLMKSEEPDITSKFNSFQEEIIQIGAIDFESDISAMFGK